MANIIRMAEVFSPINRLGFCAPPLWRLLRQKLSSSIVANLKRFELTFDIYLRAIYGRKERKIDFSVSATKLKFCSILDDIYSSTLPVVVSFWFFRSTSHSQMNKAYG